MSWWTAFALTQAIEMPIYGVGSRGSGLTVAWRIAIAFGASAITHPVVWFVLPGPLTPMLGYWGYFAVAEGFAFVAEALYLRAFDLERPWLWAFAANATSASTGLVIHALM